MPSNIGQRGVSQAPLGKAAHFVREFLPRLSFDPTGNPELSVDASADSLAQVAEEVFQIGKSCNYALEALCLTNIKLLYTLAPMQLKFADREPELRELEAAAGRGGLLVVYGRRRIGKTRLLRHRLQTHEGLYSQAIEAQRDLQIQQVFQDLRAQLETRIVPKTWPEMLEILALQRRRWTLCLDEFPYLTAVDSTLPSQLQKWVDHSIHQEDPVPHR